MQIKLASVKLAMKYMKRVSAELETVGVGPEEEELIVQGVRFAFRVHQVNYFLTILEKINSEFSNQGWVCVVHMLCGMGSLREVLMLRQ